MTHVKTDIGPYAIVPLWLVKAAPTGSALQVWVALHKWVNYNTKHAKPSKQMIADEAGVSVNTVERALSALRDVGALTWERRRTEDGDLTSNDYTLHYVRVGTPTGGEGTPTGEVTPTPADGALFETQIEREETPPTPPRGGRRKKSTPWPDGWEPDSSLVAWTHDNCPSIDAVYEWERFKGHALSNDRRQVDWRQAWQNWARKAEHDQQQRAAPPPPRVSAYEQMMRNVPR